MVMKKQKKYLKSFLIQNEILHNIFTKKITSKYPLQHIELPERYRGKPSLINIDDCIACGKCVRECPTHCIELEESENNIGEFILRFNIAQCMFCGVCAEGCSRSAIQMTDKWELASNNKKELIQSYAVSRLKKKAKKEIEKSE